MTVRGHRLSGADAAWLRMDRPTNVMVINCLLRFEGQMEWTRLAEVVQERLVEPYPRFSERVVEGRGPVAGPRWEPDPDFELALHLHRRTLPAGPGERRLRELVGSLASIPLDRRRPLWEMHLIDGPGHSFSMVVRMHHCIADGIALVRVMLSLTEPVAQTPARSRRPRLQPSGPIAAPDATPGSTSGSDSQGPLASLARPFVELPRPLGEVFSGVDDAVRTVGGLARSAVGQAGEVLARPTRLLELASEAAADGRALSKLALLPPDSPTLLKGDLDAERAVAWSGTFSLEEIKRIAHAQQATVNDVLLAAVAGALRGYLVSRGEQPNEIRAIVPYNLRPPDEPGRPELGNRFGLVFLTLPVDRITRPERLAELKRRMGEIKHSAEGPVSYAVLEAAGHAPAAVEDLVVDTFSSKASAVMTNVPGPRETVYLAGAPLRSVLVWAPTGGSVSMSVSIFSYDGGVTIGLLVHPGLLPDPQSIVGRLHRELAAMGRLVPVGSM